MTGFRTMAGRWVGKCILLITPLFLCSCLTTHAAQLHHGMPRETFGNVSEVRVHQDGSIALNGFLTYTAPQDLSNSSSGASPVTKQTKDWLVATSESVQLDVSRAVSYARFSRKPNDYRPLPLVDLDYAGVEPDAKSGVTGERLGWRLSSRLPSPTDRRVPETWRTGDYTVYAPGPSGTPYPQIDAPVLLEFTDAKCVVREGNRPHRWPCLFYPVTLPLDIAGVILIGPQALR